MSKAKDNEIARLKRLLKSALNRWTPWVEYWKPEDEKLGARIRAALEPKRRKRRDASQPSGESV